MFDTLDTYFVFLRTRILTGDVTPEQEAELVAKAKKTLAAQARESDSRESDKMNR